MHIWCSLPGVEESVPNTGSLQAGTAPWLLTSSTAGQKAYALLLIQCRGEPCLRPAYLILYPCKPAQCLRADITVQRI